MTTIRLDGLAAIAAAEECGLALHKYADPIDGARPVSLDEAREIIQADPGLIYLDVDSSAAWAEAATRRDQATRIETWKHHHIGPVLDDNNVCRGSGWYWQRLPDGEPMGPFAGPFETEAEALTDAREALEDDSDSEVHS